MMSESLGMIIKSNMMYGRPTRTKSAGDYLGLPISPCGDYDTEGGKVPRPPWLLGVEKRKSIS